MPTEITKDSIIQDLDLQRRALEKQIDALNQKILAIQSHILSLEQANKVLEQMAQSERDSATRAKYYGAIRNNIELLARLYDVVKEFEDVKFRYFKEVDDVLHNKFRLIAVEIRRIEEKLTDMSSFNLLEFFERLTSVAADSEKRKEIKRSLDEKPEYKL